MAGDYFKGEGLDIFGVYKKRIYKSLTLEQLGKAIIAGKLDDEVINS